GALLRQRRLEAAQAVDPPQRRVKAGAQALLRQRYAAGHGLAEGARILDAVGNEGIDLVEFAARDLDADVVEIEAQDAVLDQLDIVRLDKGEGQLEIDAGFGLDVDDLAEAQHDRLLALVDDEDRAPGEQQEHGADDAEDRKPVRHQLLPPSRRRSISVRGR